MRHCANCKILMTKEVFKNQLFDRRARYCSRNCWLEKNRKQLKLLVCKCCKKEFKNYRFRLTCSPECQSTATTKYGSRILIKPGYVLILTHGKNSNKRGYELEHRMLMEKKLGRDLLITEHVHHIDENRSNNDESNLVVMSQTDHIRLHRAKEQEKLKALRAK